MVPEFVLIQRGQFYGLECELIPSFQMCEKAGAMIVYRTGLQPSLQISGELDQLMASSASGLNPAVQTVVDLPNPTNTLS